MTDHIYVEPAQGQRAAFARWCLNQEPRIQTASATGSLVPADLFKSMPGELLDGAHVDGHMYRHVIEGKAPDGDGYKDEAQLVELRIPVKRTQKRTVKDSE